MVKQISILLPQASRDGNELPRQMNPNGHNVARTLSLWNASAPPPTRTLPQAGVNIGYRTVLFILDGYLSDGVKIHTFVYFTAQVTS